MFRVRDWVYGWTESTHGGDHSTSGIVQRSNTAGARQILSHHEKTNNPESV